MVIGFLSYSSFSTPRPPKTPHNKLRVWYVVEFVTYCVLIYFSLSVSSFPLPIHHPFVSRKSENQKYHLIFMDHDTHNSSSLQFSYKSPPFKTPKAFSDCRTLVDVYSDGCTVLYTSKYYNKENHGSMCRCWCAVSHRINMYTYVYPLLFHGRTPSVPRRRSQKKTRAEGAQSLQQQIGRSLLTRSYTGGNTLFCTSTQAGKINTK